MRRRQRIKEFAILSPLVVITALWLWSKSRPGGWDITVPQGLTQIVSLLAFNLMAIVMLIAARSRTVERLYGGLDKAYRTHGQLGRIAFYLMLVHPLLLIPHYMMTGQNVVHLFWFSDFWPRNVGITSYYLFLGLILLTIYRKIEYQKWVNSHSLMGIPFVLGGIHAINANSDIKAFEPLRDWVVFWLLLGTFAWLYKVFVYRRVAQSFHYEVVSAEVGGGGILDLKLRPRGARMSYEPGEFAFISVVGNGAIKPELHPFSIASDPVKHQLRFGIRQAGDYTKSLAALRPGDRVQVYGPYGEFTSYRFDAYKRQVWIGGGVGITPFLSMLSHEAQNEDHKKVTLIYSVKTASDALYDGQIRRWSEGHPDELKYVLHTSEDEGFLTADRILAECGGFQDTVFLFCGPPVMMHKLRDALIAKGCSPSQIDFEEFNFV